MKLSILIPMYNEIRNAEKTALSLKEYFDQRLGEDYEIVFCNDGSRDGCALAVSALGLERVRVIGYRENQGKGHAVRYGIMQCEGEAIVCTDCDLAYGKDSIYGIYKSLCQCDKDIVIGSRNISRDGYEGYTPIRKLMSKAYIALIRCLAGFSHTDSQCGLKCYRKDAAHDIFPLCTVNGFAFDLEVLILADKLGKSISEYPVKVVNHDESESKVNPVKDALKMIRDISRIKKTHRGK